jgi:hypothetical protein
MVHPLARFESFVSRTSYRDVLHQDAFDLEVPYLPTMPSVSALPTANQASSSWSDPGSHPGIPEIHDLSFVLSGNHMGMTGIYLRTVCRLSQQRKTWLKRFLHSPRARTFAAPSSPVSYFRWLSLIMATVFICANEALVDVVLGQMLKICSMLGRGTESSGHDFTILLSRRSICRLSL